MNDKCPNCGVKIEQEKILTTDEIAKMEGVARSTVISWVSKYGLKAEYQEKGLRIKLSDFKKFRRVPKGPKR